jgi:AraC family transcriptional regulator of adaptative response/methylated-DNA-[protein]-cysteine methyltransferase
MTAFSPTDPRWIAFEARDFRADGQFVVAVKTTRIYCRPSCPARHPLPQNITFYESPEVAKAQGYRACRRCQPDEAIPEPVRWSEEICRYLEAHLDDLPDLETLGAHFNLNPTHLQKTFKRVTGITPHQYADAKRAERLKAELRKGERVTDALLTAGYGSASWFYESNPIGVTPRDYQKGGKSMTIHYTITACPLGQLLIARTSKGICALYLGQDALQLESELSAEFPHATRTRDDQSFGEWVSELMKYLNGEQPHLALPLDVQGTAFQQKVWAALQAIPYGQTLTYGQIADQIGNPKAARAVGRACATNSVSLVIPCHRAVGASGELTGYRWGMEVKKRILDLERGE